MTRITTYIENGRSFEICQCTRNDETKGFWAFEDKFIGKDSKLLKQFNGISGHHSKTLKECIEKVSRQIKYDALVDAGMDEVTAAMTVIGLC